MTFSRAVDGVDDPTTSPVANATVRAAGADPVARAAAHTAYWTNFWNASAIDLGPAFRTLESVYYGLQYMGGSQTRTGKIPSGLCEALLLYSGPLALRTPPPNTTHTHT